MPSTLSEPEFATVLGMVNYGHRARIGRGFQEDRWGTKLKALLVGKGALRQWLVTRGQQRGLRLEQTYRTRH